MAGHSKWANIKHRKGAQDAKRGKIWTKLSKEVTVAAKIGGGDTNSNPRLRDAIAAAKSQNMPKDTIEKAVKRGTGELEGVTYEEITYEGYGPGGAAVLLECLSDNTNRSVSELRFIFSKNSGNLGESGCVNWMFKKVGMLEIAKAGVEEEELMELALENGADEIEEQDDSFLVTCAPAELGTLREALEAKYTVNRFEITATASTMTPLEGENAEKMLKLLDALDDHDDVQNVHTNADFAETE